MAKPSAGFSGGRGPWHLSFPVGRAARNAGNGCEGQRQLHARCFLLEQAARGLPAAESIIFSAESKPDMKERTPEDFSNLSMLDLFRIEAENQTGVLTSTLLEMEKAAATPAQLETLMRAAHSLKGAARIVNLQSITKLAHAMEDCFVAAQHGKVILQQAEIDVLLKAVDLLSSLSRQPAPDSHRQG